MFKAKHPFIFESYGNSHPGNYSKHNEDSSFVGSTAGTSVPYDEMFTMVPESSEDILIFAVADGVGGSEAGEDASITAVRSLQKFLKDEAADVTASNVERVLEKSVFAMHKAIKADAELDPAKDGMATTLTAVCVFSFGAWSIQIGDSRLYVFRNGKLQQISEDQSPVGKLVREGKITEEEAMIHPLRNYIDQALGGSEQTPKAVVYPLEIKDRDIWFLCTDGISDSLYPEQIQGAFLDDFGDSIEQLGCNLMDAALNAAGRDNLSVVLCRPRAQSAISRVASSIAAVANSALFKSKPD